MASQPRSTSALPTVSATITNVPSQIPVFTKKSDNSGKKTNFVVESIPSTRMTTTAPILVSNNDILSMFQQVQQQMKDQQWMNQRLIREMESLKAEKNKKVEVTTPIAPRILDFGISGMSENHPGDFIPMQTSIGTSSGSQDLGISRDNLLIPRTSLPTLITGNTYNYSSIDTTNFGSSQETGISPQVAKEIQKIRDMISSVPGVVKPIPEVPAITHMISRFAPPICDAEIPKRFQTPTMKLYDGTTDPEEHVAQYRERMETNHIPPHLKEAWPDESLRSYVKKFGRESLDIPNLDITTAVQAFKMGLQRNSPFYDDLVMNPCRNMDEVRNREKARWPPKDKKFAAKDKSKRCAFHEDFGHVTEECIALRKEISYLLSKCHLKELPGKRKERRQDPDGFPKRAASPPKDAKPEDTPKKLRWRMENGERPAKTSTLTTETVISFEEQDRENIMDPHHDGLVITLYVANHYVRMIFIDGGSSVNIIQLETLKRMNIPESEITTKSLVIDIHRQRKFGKHHPIGDAQKDEYP
ncbi:hypothetical protein E3N88_28659 [Mikania micrantha]|uniref:Retrotransposon gag domain-containing protein n=1 Tax=Mikania micrantha TaxID=192012 RepID=A0A5N6N0E4_9ASTR|nr:hypothetical protein E3N88_28659 [Mikania micrantha]